MLGNQIKYSKMHENDVNSMSMGQGAPGEQKDLKPTPNQQGKGKGRQVSKRIETLTQSTGWGGVRQATKRT